MMRKVLLTFSRKANTTQKINGTTTNVTSASFQFQKIRIVVGINNQEISYPIGYVWASPRERMHTEDFVVEASDEYTVKIAVIAMNEEGQEVNFYQSTPTEVITPNQLPISQTFQLHEKGQGVGGIAGSLTGLVTFELRSRN